MQLSQPPDFLGLKKSPETTVYHKPHFARINIHIHKNYAKKLCDFFSVSKFLLYICITNSRHIIIGGGSFGCYGLRVRHIGATQNRKFF